MNSEQEQSDLGPHCLSKRLLKHFSRQEKQETFVAIGALVYLLRAAASSSSPKLLSWDALLDGAEKKENNVLLYGRHYLCHNVTNLVIHCSHTTTAIWVSSLIPVLR